MTTISARARRRRPGAAASGRLCLRQAGRFESAAGAHHDLEPKDALLLAYLVVEGSTSRARLAALLWPDVDDERARGNLRQRLLRLKRTTGAELVTGNPQARLVAGMEHDLEDSCELLAGIQPEQAGGLSEWLEAQRERRRRVRLTVLEAAVAQAQAEGDYAVALEHANRLIDLDPWSESAHRQVMKLHYLRGDVGAAVAAYERCARLLRAELGAEPSMETLRLRSQIEQYVSPRPVAARRAPPVTILRPPRLVGRAAELAALDEAWNAGRAFLVLGEAGMGKSRLLAEFAGEGVRVIVAAARPGDAAVPYATMARVLRAALAGKPPVLPDALRAPLAQLLPELPGTLVESPDGQRLQLQRAIESVLVGVEREGVRGFVLDDVQFADDASLDMLRTIQGSDEQATLHWGFAQRSGEPAAAAQALREALEETLALTTVALEPLDVRQMAELIDSLGVPEIDGRAMAERLVRHTGGNPMFALETLKHALTNGADDAELTIPPGVGALIERRLRQLSTPAIALARVAAVAGVDFSIELAEHVLKTPALALADAWNELEVAQVLRGAVFAHDLVFESALRSIPAAIATHTHASIAEWLERSDGEPARIAAHWEASTSRQRALPWLRKAAERAEAALRPREAVAFLERAADIEAGTVSAEQAFDTLATLVDDKLHVDRSADLLPLIDRLDRLAATPLQTIGALLLRSDFSMHRRERIDEGLAAAERAVELATHAGLDWFRVGGTLNAAILHSMRGDARRATEVATPIVAEVRRWHDPRQRVNLLIKVGFVLQRAGQTTPALDLFDEAVVEAQSCRHTLSQIVALAHGASAMLRLLRPDEALIRLERADALHAAHDKVEGMGGNNDWYAAMALRLLGRYTEALQRIQRVIDVMRERSPGSVTGTLATRANLWLDLGQTTRAIQDRELAQRAVGQPADEHELALLDLRLAVDAKLRPDAARARGRALTEAQTPCAIALLARLRLTPLLPSAESIAAAHAVAAAAHEAEFRGLEASAWSRAAIAEMENGGAFEAVAHARLAVELAAGCNTDDLTWPAILYHAAVVHQQAGHAAEARRLAERGAVWLREIASRSVPPEFRDSFLRRNLINRELLRRATIQK